MIKRLRIKFICINMTIVTAMLLVVFGMVLEFTAEDLQRQSVGMMMGAQDNRGFPGPPPERREEVRLPSFRVTRNPMGEEVILYHGFDEQLEEETLQEMIRLARESGSQSGLLREYRLRFGKVPGPFGEELVFVDASNEIATMRGLVRTCGIVGVLSFAVFLLLSILLSRWAVRPLEEAWNQQRQFVADASHELKTPLTVILTNAELLQDPAYDEKTRKTFSESILTMSHQMRFLVESLLDLARLDNGSAKMVFEPLDFGELAGESLLPFEPVYFERQLQLEAQLQEGLRVMGSRTHLKQVLDILLDNGAKYTTPGGTVRVTLRRQGNHGLLCVAGPGETISREDLKNIFRRFYRIDKARSRDGSYGLGLSIAESIVTEHGGKIWAGSEQGINSFFVQFPLL